MSLPTPEISTTKPLRGRVWPEVRGWWRVCLWAAPQATRCWGVLGVVSSLVCQRRRAGARPCPMAIMVEEGTQSDLNSRAQFHRQGPGCVQSACNWLVSVSTLHSRKTFFRTNSREASLLGGHKLLGSLRIG